MLTHSVFDHATQRYVMNEIKQPANAFEWKRFVVEEADRRGDKAAPDAGETSRKRSTASTKAVERNRLGVVPTPKIAGEFHIYNQAIKKAKKK
jgi:hypothetical protein